MSLNQMELVEGGGCGWTAVGYYSTAWGCAITALTMSGPLGWVALGIGVIGLYASVDGMKNC